jgi:alpha-galactosidase
MVSEKQHRVLSSVYPTHSFERASKIADSWRISNDIQDNWASIWRITNEVVPYFKHTTVGAYPDMDMLM